MDVKASIEAVGRRTRPWANGCCLGASQLTVTVSTPLTNSFAAMLTAAVLLCGGGADAQTTTESREWVEPTTGMLFVTIDPGRFVMGSPPDEIGRQAQETPHQVKLSCTIWFGAFEVTQKQWRLVMGENPSHFRAEGDMLPVENVTWHQAHEFLERLTKRAPGNRFRLPTEAEWEYACRAGSGTAYAVGAVLTAAQANFAESPNTAAAGRTSRVGSFAPNAWGLYDMHGNVWEWTADDYCPYAVDGAVADPVATCQSSLKVIRGGSWYFGADSARCALRYTHRPQDRGFSIGFRVVRESSPPA